MGAIAEVFKKISGRFPSLQKGDAKPVWGTIVEESSSCFALYRGDGIFLGEFYTHTMAVEKAIEEGLVLID